MASASPCGTRASRPTSSSRRSSQHQHAGPADEAQAELLQAVRELRADLARFVTSDATEVLDAELVSVAEALRALLGG